MALDRSTIWPYRDGEPGEFYYQRYAHPTGVEAERRLGDLDGGHAILFASGAGATTALALAAGLAYQAEVCPRASPIGNAIASHDIAPSDRGGHRQLADRLADAVPPPVRASTHSSPAPKNSIANPMSSIIRVGSRLRSSSWPGSS